MDVKRRDRHDIIAEILKVAKHGKIKTHLMFDARLSHHQFNVYISLLIDKGLVRNLSTGNKKLYRTTKKGLMFVENFQSLNDLLEYSFKVVKDSQGQGIRECKTNQFRQDKK